jgi:hypothetical protein
MTREDKINGLNIILIAISLLASWFTPVHLFLFAYAVLGPLHYLTEISWLHDRSYFIADRKAPKLLIGLGIVYLFIPLTIYFYKVNSQQIYFWYQLSGLLVFAALAVSVLAVISQRGLISVKAAAVMAIAAVMVIFSPYLTLFFASYVTTLVHVFVFTWIFMLSGALKSGRMSGFAALAFFTLCAVAALYPAAGVNLYVPRELLIALQSFGRLDIRTAQLLGWHQPEQVFAIMRFIAFAYTYHYLNWFSKTQIIGWHRISRRRIALIAALYVVALSLYAMDYATGFKAVLFLSLIHVYLEFPLNIKTIMSLRTQFNDMRRQAQVLRVPAYAQHATASPDNAAVR